MAGSIVQVESLCSIVLLHRAVLEVVPGSTRTQASLGNTLGHSRGLAPLIFDQDPFFFVSSRGLLVTLFLSPPGVILNDDHRLVSGFDFFVNVIYEDFCFYEILDLCFGRFVVLPQSFVSFVSNDVRVSRNLSWTSSLVSGSSSWTIVLYAVRRSFPGTQVVESSSYRSVPLDLFPWVPPVSSPASVLRISFSYEASRCLTRQTAISSFSWMCPFSG